MVDILKPPTTAKFNGAEVYEEQKVGIPKHNRVNFLGKKLPGICSSTVGIIVFRGGCPKLVAVANCSKREDSPTQVCFYHYKAPRNRSKTRSSNQ